MKLFCSVYKSSRKAEMYVYVDRKSGVEALPESLLSMCGEPSHVLDMVLTQDKKLARAEAQEVLAKIAEQGFYLQMPPGNEQVPVAMQAPRDTLHG